jgi:RNA polymerase subunit RPABC4/transcription elongation factor Spt4
VSSKNVVQFRQRRKKWSVDAFGGKCGICGYDRCVEALEFHHIDPNQKDFTPSASTVSRQLFVEELRKCVCLCANCHREVHFGIISIPNDIAKFDETFSIKPFPEKPKHACKECGKLINTTQKFCSVKCSTKSREVANWPTIEDLYKLVLENGYSATGRIFGVSDNAVRKRLRRSGIFSTSIT